jgi:hypothetical protein
MKKNPPCQKAWRDLRIYFCELYQLFSSFLRGASRPKSPRDTASAATPFMEESRTDVKGHFRLTQTDNDLVSIRVKLS